jgi:Cu2+-exporting ATPase
MQRDDRSTIHGDDSESGVATAPRAAPCFHCGDALVPGADFRVTVDGALRAMCCAGCAAVAQTIVDAGLEDYYRLRTELPSRAGERVPRILEQAAVYRRPALEDVYAHDAAAHAREANLILEGIECAACAWLVERTLADAPGMLEAAVNFSSHRARVRWDPRATNLGAVMEAVARVGYGAQPYDPARREALLEVERHTRLRRLAVAGLFGMQIMVLAVVLYAGEWWGMQPAFRTLFRWASLALALPVVGYAAWPFFSAAARGLANRSPGMDLPVALGIGIAFAASARATVSGDGHVYFDSVAMFTFFLLLARHVEFLARKRAQERTEALVSPAPELARRLSPGGDAVFVPVAELDPGDRVRVLPGESVPADGVVCAGAGTVDESLLSGESRPVPRRVGDAVLGGSLNGQSPLEVRVRRIGADMVVSRVLALVERAAEARPRLARLADRVAAVFVTAVLLVAGSVAAWWWHADAARWLPVTVAVLVVTCPCALSLATPTALTAAAGTLTALGLVPSRGLALETLARVDHVVFDKTGTLTGGHYRVLETRVLSGGAQAPLLRVAASLERHSEHPIARAIEALVQGPVATAEEVLAEAGCGVSARVAEQRWWLGSPRWACDGAGVQPPDLSELACDGDSVVLLAGERGELCAFRLGDEIRDDARSLIDALHARGIRISLYSGDRPQAVDRVADALGIAERAGGLLPGDKLARLQALADDGRTTMMVGDGVNDAPVLAGAAVSVAMGSGAQAARASADFILVSERLHAVSDALDVAARARRVVVQNMAWAIGYNLLALPAAAAGLVAPWMAAVGMSLSSLLVVGNSARLSSQPAPPRRAGAAHR